MILAPFSYQGISIKQSCFNTIFLIIFLLIQLLAVKVNKRCNNIVVRLRLNWLGLSGDFESLNIYLFYSLFLFKVIIMIAIKSRCPLILPCYNALEQLSLYGIFICISMV